MACHGMSWHVMLPENGRRFHTKALMQASAWRFQAGFPIGGISWMSRWTFNGHLMDLWWISGGFMVDLWWIYGGFMVDLSSNIGII